MAISGSLRSASTNTAALRAAVECSERDLDVAIFDGLVALPHFNPDDDVEPLPLAVVALRDAVHDADALLFSTPEYAGALPGSFKNLLDWLIGDDQPRSIYEKPVAWMNTSPRAATLAYESLRTVLGYARAQIVESACVDVPVIAGEIDTVALERIRASVRTLRGFVMRDDDA